jgi:hypothetical protein
MRCFAFWLILGLPNCYITELLARGGTCRGCCTNGFCLGEWRAGLTAASWCEAAASDDDRICRRC